MSSYASKVKISNRLWVVMGMHIAIAFGAGPAAYSEVYLDITKEPGKRITLAVTPFSNKEGREETALRQILEQDLTIAGHFQLLPLETLQRELFQVESETGAINFATWSAWGTELLLRTAYQRKEGMFLLTASLYDVGNRKRLLGKEYRGRPSQGINAVHTLADDIIRALTGERGLTLTRIAFAWGKDGPKRISVMDYDGRTLYPVSPAGVLALYPSWFPDGTRLAYVTYRYGRPEIVSHNLQTGRIRSLAFFPGLNAFPAISPDGKSMLLTLSRDGNPEIYRLEIDGSELKRLTFTPAVEASPVWSPDRKQIAFISDRTGSPQIYISASRGGRARRVSYVSHYSTSPDWSPKKGQIAFTSLMGGTFQLSILDLASGKSEQLTFDKGNKEDPSWAPNGRHLVFSQGRGSNYRLFLLDTLTGDRFPISRKKGNFTSPAWSP